MQHQIVIRYFRVEFLLKTKIKIGPCNGADLKGSHLSIQSCTKVSSENTHFRARFTVGLGSSLAGLYSVAYCIQIATYFIAWENPIQSNWRPAVHSLMLRLTKLKGFVSV